jgi:hypothetical protein
MGTMVSENLKLMGTMVSDTLDVMVNMHCDTLQLQGTSVLENKSHGDHRFLRL